MFGLGFPLLDASVSVPGWSLHADVIAWLILLEGGYLWATVGLHRRSPDSTPVSPDRVFLFSLGVLAFYLAAGTPLHDLGEHYLFSAHMLEHLILTLIAPPLLLLGIPDWMLRPVLRWQGVRSALFVVTRPFLAFALFNVITLFTHLPSSMDLLLHHHTLHFFSHVLLTGSAMLMWWPVLGCLPELPRLSYPLQLVYLFGQSFLPSVLTAFIIFTGTVIYPFYRIAPKVWGLSAVEDQRIGGLIMKLGGTVVLWSVGTVVFFLWFQKEQQEEPPVPPPPPPLVWQDVEEELTRMGLTDSKTS